MNLTQITGLVLATLVLLNAQLSAQQPNKTAPQSQSADAAVDAAKPNRYAIAIHGGAGSNPKIFSEAQNDRRRASMQKALQIGTDILKNGGSSLDAVEQVVRFLENDSQFNAGVGAVFNAAGSHELDASIMDGKNQACGAVAGVSIVTNPISLARKVMTDTPHVLLAGAGAEAFAKEMKVPLVDPSHFDTSATLKYWNQRQARLSGPTQTGQSKLQQQPTTSLDQVTGSYHGTVGCVALDTHGNLAAATSTGGLSGKKYGRVGDSPIVGAGTFANNETCAVSCTGKGEQYIRNAVAYDVAARMKYAGQTIDQAVKTILTETLNRGDGGIIAVDKTGKITMQYNTGGMARAAADSNGRFEVLWAKPVAATP